MSGREANSNNIGKSFRFFYTQAFKRALLFLLFLLFPTFFLCSYFSLLFSENFVINKKISLNISFLELSEEFRRGSKTSLN